MLKLEFVDQSQTSFWIVDESFNIGSSNKNQMVVLRDNILPVHANVTAYNNNVAIEPVVPEAKVSVNYVPIITRTALKVGDVVSLAGTEIKLIDPSVRQKTNLPSSVAGLVSDANKQLEDNQTAAAALASQAQSNKENRAQPWKIKAISGAHKDKLIDISDTLSVGRDSSNDLVITGGHISRRHAELYVKNQQLLVRDLDSSNGTSVNGDRIKERAVYLGDEIGFDSVVFRVAVGKAATTINESSMDKTQFRPALNLDALRDDVKPEPEPLKLKTDHIPATAEMKAQDVSAVLSGVQPALDTTPLEADAGTEGTQKTKVSFKDSLKKPSKKDRTKTENGASKPQSNTYLIALGIFFLLALIAAGIAFL